MKTSTFFFWLVSLIVFLIFPSCSLDEKLLDETTGEELLKEENIETNILAPAYAMLIQLPFNDIYGIQESCTDEMVIPTRSGDWYDQGMWQRLQQHRWRADDASMYGSWKVLDAGVAQANTGLFLLDDQNDPGREDLIRSMKAELRFLRVYFRYNILDMFRQVPMRHEMDRNFNQASQVFDAENAFNWLVDEFLAIIPDLRDHPEVPYGRVTRQAAQTLLAKLYLNAKVYIGEEHWQQCADMCDEVIESGFFFLSPDYFDIFSVNNDITRNEAIFVVRQSLESPNRAWNGTAITLHYNQNLGFNKLTFNGFSAGSQFLRSWDQDGDPSNGITTTDSRFQDDRIKPTMGANLGFLIGPQFHPNGDPIPDWQRSSMENTFVQLEYTIDISSLTNALQHEGARVLKYEPDPESDFIFRGRNDFLLLRFADVWLMKAETLFRLGQKEVALGMINQLRTLRNAPELPELTEQAILDERGFELYWEGCRRQDLIRFGQFTAGAWEFKEKSDITRRVFPIPQTALDINRNLKQNPGY